MKRTYQVHIMEAIVEASPKHLRSVKQYLLKKKMQVFQ